MQRFNKVVALLLCVVMLIGFVPVSALAADAAGNPTIVIAGSDYQASNSGTTMQNIMNKIKEDYSSVYGILMGGDYDAGDVSPNANHLTAADNTISAVYPGIAEENRIMIQGNHETYGNLSPSSNSLLDATGAHDTDYYGVYAINYENFDSAASGLQTYLNGKSGYTKPIFVMSHQPLHKTSRGDNNAAVNLFNVLNNYDNLNIIFLFGHNHSQGYDAYLGNGSIYLKKGDSITVAGGSTSTLNFTYMNYGYVGYIGTNHGSADQTLTMTTFEIYEDEVIIKRYDTSGQHVLKAAGNTTDSGYTADTNVYGQAVLSLSDGESTISEISADSGDDNTGSGTTGGSGWTYELVTSIEAGEKYVIVGDDDAVALMDNNGSFGSQTVTISGTTLTSDVALTEWTISGTDNGTIISDAGNQLGYNNSAWGLVTGGTVEFDITANDGNFKVQMQRGYNNYNFYYNGTNWTDKSTSDQYVRLYKLTGSGSGGGSTVTPEGGDWVTISSGEGGTIYTLDTDGVSTGENYLIVSAGADGTAQALRNNNGTVASAEVTISNGQIVTGETDVVWTYDTSKYLTNGSHSFYLSYNNTTSFLSTSEKRAVAVSAIDQEKGSYSVKRDGSNYAYYLNYSEADGWTNSGQNGSEQAIYFFVESGTAAAGDAEYAKLDGELTYTVSRGASAEDALAAVKAGIDVLTSASADGSDPTTLDDANTDITWTMSGYDGTVAGEYAVTISYKGVKLGTAKVIVPEVTIIGYDCQTSGSVKVGASGNVRTGANITVNLEDGSSYTVPVTMSMLSKDGEKITATEGGEITGLTVTYNGVVVCENFTLTVREPSSYPEYPDEGAVQVKKTGTGVQFQSTGVAQVEISASGIPMNQGVDILLILDTSSSMGMNGSLTDGRTRIDVLKECVNALIANLQDERADGSVPDVSIAVVHFNGYTGNKNTNYIGSTARSTSTLGGVLTDDGNGGAWVDVQNMGANWAANIPDDCSGTNYDHGLLLAYDLLSARQEAESSRKQFALFMSDGAPFQYNGVNSNSLSTDWENWILGSYTQAEVEALTHVSNPEFYYGSNNGNGQKHRVAEAIKGTGLFEIVTYSDTSSSGTTKLETVPGLGVTMYSVGLALEATNMPTDVAGQEAILKTIASSEDVFYSVTSAAGLQEAFDDFAGEVLMAATNARFVDQMGDAYDLQMGDILDLNDKPIDVENKIEVISYDIWTRSDYLAGKCTADKIGDRKGTSTVLETITFNADGTEAYSSKVSTGPNGETIAAGSNILIGGVIYAQSFWYNSNHTAAEITGVDIPTGVNSTTDLTTGSTNVLPAETFYWKVGTIKTTELAMRYYVYLTGSMEGTREAGSYPTNNYANLYYNNYLNQPVGQPCYKDTVSPVLAWEAANVSYAFYLVDENGNIIVNQTTGETGSFANKIAVTNPVVYEEVLLNNTDTVESIEVASLGVLPDGYELYDKDAVYTIQIKSDATGSWTIAKGDDKVASTYVTQYDPGNAAAYSSELTKNSDADFTHTVVWFAVLWKVQALPDTVVIDYGLPVDISVLANDMFGENGKLAGVGACSDSLNLDGHDAAMASGFGNTYNGEYGSAKADAATGKVRYTPANMQMNGYEKFAYAVNYTGSANRGYYYDTVTVIPATTIYYEDSFVTYNDLQWQQKAGGELWEGEWIVNEDPEVSVWSPAGETDPDAVQAEDRPGRYSLTDANNIYGYDAAYANMSTYSLGSAMKATVDYDRAAQASFTFYGTGFDIISLTDSTTGMILLDVYEVNEDGSRGARVRGASVDTYYGYTTADCHVVYTWSDGTWLMTDILHKQAECTENCHVDDAIPEEVVEGTEIHDIANAWIVDPTATGVVWQVPVMEVEGLTYGHYEAVIQAVYDPAFDHVDGPFSGTYDFYLDAIRIYDPADDGASDGAEDNTIEKAYGDDGEGWPSYIELRNKLIPANSFADVASQEGMVFIDGDPEIGDDQLEDYISYGPNNEVYLAANQSVAFLVDAPANLANIHIGISSANGTGASYSIYNIAQATDGVSNIQSGSKYNEKSYTVSTATDMYYDLSTWKNDIIVIRNSGEGIISLTNIKSTYTSDPAQQPSGAATFSLRAAQPQLTSIYMTASAATLVLDELNREEIEELPEETVPETTVPEEIEPEPTAPEETEPEVFEPKLFVVSVNKDSVKVGQKVGVTITTSSEVDYVTVNGKVISRPNSDKKGVRTWNLSVTAARAGIMELNVICFNTADEASEPVTRQIAVRSKSGLEMIFDLIFDIFD